MHTGCFTDHRTNVVDWGSILKLTRFVRNVWLERTRWGPNAKNITQNSPCFGKSLGCINSTIMEEEAISELTFSYKACLFVSCTTRSLSHGGWNTLNKDVYKRKSHSLHLFHKKNKSLRMCIVLFLKKSNLRSHRRWQCIFCDLGYFSLILRKLNAHKNMKN